MLFDIHCVGTIPVHILPGPKPDLPGLSLSMFKDRAMTTPAEPPYQLHTCDEIWVYIEFHMTNDMGYEQGAGIEGSGVPAYTFSWTFLAHQYNEEP